VGKVPAVQFHGYRLIEKYPEFRYDVDGVEVRELIKPAHHGGIEDTFTITGAKGPVFYVSDPKGGAVFASSAGQFKDGVLEPTPEQAGKFTVTLTEIPSREPLAYYSMNDVAQGQEAVARRGHERPGHCFRREEEPFATGIKTDAITTAGTIAIWRSWWRRTRRIR